MRFFELWPVNAVEFTSIRGITLFTKLHPHFLILSLLISACSSSKSFHRAEATGGDHPAAPVSNDMRESGEKDGAGAIAPGATAPKSAILIYNATISLEATESDVKTLTGKIVDKVKGQGGYLSQRSSNSLTVRVPAKEFTTANDFIRTLAKVKYESSTAQDITMQYTDLSIRLDVQLKMLARYQDLLKKANSVKDAVEVERELSRITERVEQLKGQIRYYDSQVAYSTITVNFQEPYTAFNKETKPGPLGWVFYGLYVGVKWLFVWD
jgi:Domain of unknown function (DUF4349)